MPRVSVRALVRIAGAALVASLAVPAAVFAQAQAGPYGAEAVKALEEKKKAADAAAAARAQAGGGAAPQPGKPAPPSAPPAAAPAPTGTQRDPFEPLVAKPREGEDRPSLSGLRLVGVLWDPRNRAQVRALVETPDGLGYYLRVDEEKFGAKVVGIDRDRVRFSVREQDPGGQVRTRTVELKLSE